MSIFLEGASVFIANWRLIMGVLVLVAIIILPLLPRLKTDLEPASVSATIFLALFLFVSLILRMAYVSVALFPSYFDSAQHYLMIKNIMEGGLSYIFETLQTNYYHLGFHVIAAFFASIFQTEITTTMLVLGQVILALLPLPFYFIVKYVSRSDYGGVLALFLSAFGWYMPSHAVDWGKYPALMSMGLIPLVLGSVYWFTQEKNGLRAGKRVFFLGLLGLGVLLTFVVHSRSLIVIGIVAIASMMSFWWGKLPELPKRLIFILLLAVLVLAAIFIQRQDILSLLFDPYLNKGILTTLLILFLSVFAYKAFPQLTFTIALTVELLLVSLFIPVRGLFPGRDYLTLMDRPYVEMILFMPLSLLGGLGLAGLEKRISISYQRVAVLAGIGLVLIFAVARYEFFPSTCCVIVGNDDAAAMAWVANQLPVDARIGIASTDLKVVAADVVEGQAGADAGIWITPLTGRATITIPYGFEFDKQEILDLLCTNRIGYLFVGQLGQNFDETRLNSRPEWYRPLLSMPRTRVYEVIGCD